MLELFVKCKITSISAFVLVIVSLKYFPTSRHQEEQGAVWQHSPHMSEVEQAK